MYCTSAATSAVEVDFNRALKRRIQISVVAAGVKVNDPPVTSTKVVLVVPNEATRTLWYWAFTDDARSTSRSALAERRSLGSFRSLTLYVVKKGFSIQLGKSDARFRRQEREGRAS